MTRFLAAAYLLALSSVAAPPQPKVLLVADGDGSFTAQGLKALDVPHKRLTHNAAASASIFDYDLVIWGMDQTRNKLNRDQEGIASFLDLGGVFIGFRSKAASETWPPSPIGRDRGYNFGKVLVPDHPIFRQPHAFTDQLMRDVHGGSTYNAFCELGSGWTPLASTGTKLGWDKREERVPGPHYGIVELKHGKGLILLLDMIPAYNWFHDAKGNAESPGARFFENIIRYALDLAPTRAAQRPTPVVPEAFHPDLAALLRSPRRGDGVPMDDRWSITCTGPYSAVQDRRGVLTFRHSDTVSTEGNGAEATATLTLPAKRQNVTLLWYESDTYCGGRERILGGAKHGQTALQNYKRGFRFKQVLVDGKLVWEDDVLGRNPQPARRRRHQADITSFLDPGADSCSVTLRVLDKKGSGDQPFAIETFFAAVEVATDLVRVPFSQFHKGGAARVRDDGSIVPETATGRLSGDLSLPKGAYRLAVRLRDGAYGRSSVRLSVDGRPAATWKLTADDHRYHWAVTPLIEVARGQFAVDVVRDSDEAVVLAEMAAIPERLVALPPQPPEATEAGVTEHVSFELTVANSAGVARHGEMAVQGVPFPRGCVRSPRNMRVTDAAGRALPLQARPFAYWPDKSIKVAAVAFPAEVTASGSTGYRFEAGAGVKAFSEPVGLQLTESADRITVHTGAIEATLSKTHGTLLETVTRDGRILKGGGARWDLAFLDESGRELRSSASAVASTDIVERGPNRALIVRKGVFADEAGALIDYRIQTELYAGSDAIRFQVFIVNREDAGEVYLRRWSMELGLPDSAAERLWLSSDKAVVAEAGETLYQHTERTLTWTGQDPLSRVKGNCPGYLRLAGFAMGTRWFWQRYPQAIRFLEGVVRQDFLPEPMNDKDLPVEWKERMAERTDKYRVGGVGYPQSPGKMGLFRLARGEALRQEIFFRFDGKPVSAPVEEALAPLVAPLRASPDPEYVSGTAVFGELQPHDPVTYPEYETSVERFYQNYHAKRRRRREYGFQNFGDDTFEWGYGPSHTYWSNCEYDHHHGFALQYVRSGDLRWWEECEASARFYSDTVVIHHEPEGSGRPQRGGPRHHNYTALWMESHPDQPWIADHTMKGADSGHAWAQGVVDYWYLTGDPWAGKVMQNMAEWYCRIVEQNRYGAGGQERGPGWALVATSALARATNDPRVIAAGNKVAEWLINWQDPIRGVVSVPISEQPSYEGGTVFMHGIVGRGLGRWYDVTGDPRVRDAVIGIAEWLITEPMGQPGRFWYKQAPRCMKRYGATSQTISALSYAYTLSGEKAYAEIAEKVLDSTGASVRGMGWFPQVLAQTRPLRWPARLTLSTTQLAVAPDQPGTVTFTARNTAAEAVTLELLLDVPSPFRAKARRAVVVPPGQESRLDIEVSCQKPGAEGEVKLHIVTKTAGGQVHNRSFAITVRSYRQLSRVAGDVREARIEGAMALRDAAGESPYIEDIRPKDFSGKPLAADQPGGGTATWTIQTDSAAPFTLWAEVKWLDAKGNSFHLSVDGKPETVLGNYGAMARWLWVRGPTLELTEGSHKIRVRTREEGSKLRGVWLSTIPGDVPPGNIAQ